MLPQLGNDLVRFRFQLTVDAGGTVRLAMSANEGSGARPLMMMEMS